MPEMTGTTRLQQINYWDQWLWAPYWVWGALVECTKVLGNSTIIEKIGQLVQNLWLSRKLFQLPGLALGLELFYINSFFFIHWKLLNVISKIGNSFETLRKGIIPTGTWNGATCAVKVISHARGNSAEVFAHREAGISTDLHHPNVVQTFIKTTRSFEGSNSTRSEVRKYFEILCKCVKGLFWCCISQYKHFYW